MHDLPQLPRVPTEPQIAERRRSFVRLMIFISFVLACAMIFQIWHAWRLHSSTVGDGRTIESYGYNLSNLTVSADVLVPSRLPRDGRLTLLNPPSVTAAEVDELNEEYARQGQWRRIAVSSDLVIGVQMNGEARAYPIRYMLWHEIVNDQLGGVPLAVTYHPLCASAVAFDRRIDGEVHDFGFSGLLYNSNLVMYDRRDNRADESLWSQIALRPIAGPAVDKGKKLDALPLFLGKFEEWRKAHPDTTVFPGDRRLKNQYKDNPYQAYYREGQPIFPVKPAVSESSPFAAFQPVLALNTSEGWVVHPHAPDEAVVRDSSEPVIFALWFAWQAIRGEEPPLQ
jgi:hypothetical protein